MLQTKIIVGSSNAPFKDAAAQVRVCVCLCVCMYMRLLHQQFPRFARYTSDNAKDMLQTCGILSSLIVPCLMNINILETHIIRVGQNHIHTVYIRYSWQKNHLIYGHVRCTCTVLANPTHHTQNMQKTPVHTVLRIVCIETIHRTSRNMCTSTCVYVCVFICICVCRMCWRLVASCSCQRASPALVLCWLTPSNASMPLRTEQHGLQSCTPTSAASSKARRRNCWRWGVH